MKGDGLDHAEVAAEAFGDSGILDFYGECASALRRAMHLADRGGVGGLGFEGVKNLPGIFPEFPAKCSHDERVGERRCGILGAGELLRVGGWEQGLVDAEHLRQLERSAFQFAEGAENLAGISFLKVIRIGVAADGLASVVLEIVHADARPSACEGGHAVEAMAADTLLCAQDIFPQAEGARKRARSNAESIACVRMTSKAKATVFSMNASVRSKRWLSSLRRKAITARKWTYKTAG